MSKTSDAAPRQTWLRAIADAARGQRIELPAFGQYGMGALRSATTASGRFATLKRRLENGTTADDEGVEWALWQEAGELPEVIAAFGDRRWPADDTIATTFSLLKGWLVDQWTPDEAKRAVSKHPGARLVKPPPQVIARPK